MSRSLTLVFLMMLSNSGALAAPDPPFEYLLLRAKNILIAEVLSTDIATEQHTVSFHVITVLRGDSTKNYTLPFEMYENFKKGSQWILLSQGDNRYGEPRDVLSRPMEGQGVWRGWIPIPLSTVGEKTYAGRIFSFCDGEPYWDIQSPTDGDCLELSRIKRLIQRFPYNPTINK